jgi:hypothetical protein
VEKLAGRSRHLSIQAKGYSLRELTPTRRSAETAE